MAQCRSCGEEITWCVTTNGKKIPIDVEPNERGQFLMVGSEAGDRGEKVPVVKRTRSVTGELYQTHFETCPQADSHRKSRNARNGEAPHTKEYYEAYFKGAADGVKRCQPGGSLHELTEDQALAQLRGEYRAAVGK